MLQLDLRIGYEMENETDSYRELRTYRCLYFYIYLEIQIQYYLGIKGELQ